MMYTDEKVEVIDCECGDWVVVKVGGEIYYEGHSVPQHEWIDLLSGFNIQVSSKVISDEDMEYGNY